MQLAVLSKEKLRNWALNQEWSDVLDIEKNKAILVLGSIGFRIPIKVTKSGFIGSISYKKENVNILGEAFSKVFQEVNSASEKRSIPTKIAKFTTKEKLRRDEHCSPVYCTKEKARSGKLF